MNTRANKKEYFLESTSTYSQEIELECSIHLDSTKDEVTSLGNKYIT